MSSKFERHVYDSLRELFPYTRVARQVYVKYKGKRLFFDFYIKELDVYIECQGRQHTEYVRHFHKNMFGFMESKERDKLKQDYVCDTDSLLVYLDYDKHLNITPDELMEVIYDSYKHRPDCKKS